MNPDTDKIQALIVMAERLTQAIEGDIAALKAGRPNEMRTLDPEIQKLSLQYGREAQSFDPKRTASAPAEMRKKLVAVTGRFRESLAMHARMITRVKNASEGLVKTVAEEVEKKRAAKCTYTAPNARYRAPTQAMLYNGVV
jgi:hypothetical protein